MPRLYAIVDAGCFGGIEAMLEFAAELMAGGATLIQYRNKDGNPREVLSAGRELRRVAGNGVRLVMNDRADLCLAAGFDGVHVGQDDLPPEAARKVVGPERWVGISTHNLEQLRDADAVPVDYVAVGPVFATRTKQKPDPVIGLAGVREARSLTQKPLVAIGGITRGNAAAVLDAGADALAVIADLLIEPRRAADDFLRISAVLG